MSIFIKDIGGNIFLILDHVFLLLTGLNEGRHEITRGNN